MDAADSIPLGHTVLPGGSIDLAVDMIAPLAPGRYQGFWKLQDAQGHLFGVGSGGHLSLWVKIEVLEGLLSEATTPALAQSDEGGLPEQVISGRAARPPGFVFDLDRGEAQAESGADILWAGELIPQGGSARRTRDAIYADHVSPMTRALLVQYADVMARDAELERRLEKALDDEWLVRDDASPALRRLRREMAGAEGELVRMLERLMAKLEPHHQVSDASVTVRNGRYVIPIRKEGVRSAGGIGHDTSASGATAFIEPPAAVEAGNRIREMAIEEQREEAIQVGLKLG